MFALIAACGGTADTATQAGATRVVAALESGTIAVPAQQPDGLLLVDATTLEGAPVIDFHLVDGPLVSMCFGAEQLCAGAMTGDVIATRTYRAGALDAGSGQVTIIATSDASPDVVRPDYWTSVDLIEAPPPWLTDLVIEP
jgi:hypothetical protein